MGSSACLDRPFPCPPACGEKVGQPNLSLYFPSRLYILCCAPHRLSANSGRVRESERISGETTACAYDCAPEWTAGSLREEEVQCSVGVGIVRKIPNVYGGVNGEGKKGG